MAKLSVSQYIKKLESNERKLDSYKKTLGLELKGALQRNISKGNIKPKTVKKRGKTLFDKGAGIKNINYAIKGNIISFGNFLEYMGVHITGVDKTVSKTSKNGNKYTVKMKIPKRNWLFWSDEAKKIIKAWGVVLFK